MFKTNFYASILVVVVAISYIFYTLNHNGWVFDLTILYTIMLLSIGEFIAFTTSINIQNIVYKRTQEESTLKHIPQTPFRIKKALIYLPINIALLIFTILITYFFLDDILQPSWHIILLLPFAVHMLALIPYFLFLDQDEVQAEKEILDEEDKNIVLINIGKKLANKESQSCRKTNTKEYQTVLYFLQNGLNPNDVFEDKYTLLLPGACCGDLKLAKLLIEHGADVNFKSSLGLTALHLATKNNLPDLVKLLVENKADVNIEDFEGKTPLYYAQKNGFKDIENILIGNETPTKQHFD